MNHFEISGYATRDPELKKTGTGKSTCSFSIGQRVNKDKTQFVYVTAWDKTAEYASQYIKKGDYVIVEGRINIYEKQDKTSVTNLVADRLERISRQEKQEQQAYGRTSTPQQPTYKAATADQPDGFDLPF